MEFPEPVIISVAVELDLRPIRIKMGVALGKLGARRSFFSGGEHMKDGSNNLFPVLGELRILIYLLIVCVASFKWRQAFGKPQVSIGKKFARGGG